MRLHLSHVACLVVLGGPAWAQVPAPVPRQAVPSLEAPQKIDKFELKFETKIEPKIDAMLDKLDQMNLFKLDSPFAFELKKEAEWLKGQTALLSDEVRAEVEMAFQNARVQIETNMPNRPGGPLRVVVGGDAYTRGLNAVSQRQYDRAITAFDQVIAAKGPRSDAALYWKGFAQFRLAKSSEALAAVAQLRKEYPQSAYLKDAGVLEADARRMSGQTVNPASLQDADIKLLAIQSLQNQKSPNVVPLLEGVLTATNELEVKKRALYVLALNEEPQAHQLLLRYAKGGGNPDLQVEAIRRLGSRGDGKTTSSAELREIYDGTSDANVKMAVIDALRSSMSKDALIGIASAPSTSADVRGRAISSLSGVANPADVMAMYQKETDRNLKLQMVNVLGSMRAADQLAQIVRTEKDTAVRQRAIRSLGSTRVESSKQMLVDLYAAEQDKETRKVIINTMADQNNAEGLIALGRKETAPDVKVEIVRRLSEMARSSKPAADYMAELLK